MFDLIGRLTAFFYALWPSYGMSIVFLTLAVMVLVTPLTLKSTKSMLQMQRLQPELKRIQNQHKDDRQKMNEELMAFYQENGINPLGGCLPLLVQLPIFLVLFRVVQGLTRRVTGIGQQSGWTAGRLGGGGVPDGEMAADRTFDPENLDETTELYDALSNDTEMVSWGIDLSRSAQAVLTDSFVTSLPYLLLIAIVLVSSLYQQRQIQGRNTGAQINPQQQAIMRVLPFMLPVFAFTMPAALVVYFVISNLFRIGQQGYITHSLYSGEDSPGAQLAKQRAEERKGGKSGRPDTGSGGGRTTPKKGEPTPKRDGSRPSTKGAKGAKDTKAAKGTKGAKATKGTKGTKAAKDTKDAKATKGTKSAKNAKGSGRSSAGAGRTGRAPSRQHRGGGRTTEPGTPQNRKRRK